MHRKILTLLVVGAVWQARRDPELARDPRRIGALAAAALIGVQLAANYWSYTYLVWVFPLVALALLPAPGARRARAPARRRACPAARR